MSIEMLSELDLKLLSEYLRNDNFSFIILISLSMF